MKANSELDLTIAILLNTIIAEEKQAGNKVILFDMDSPIVAFRKKDGTYFINENHKEELLADYLGKDDCRQQGLNDSQEGGAS